MHVTAELSISPNTILRKASKPQYNVSETAFETNAMHLYTWI